jgi:phage baseplate assembly protein gpV
MGLGEALAGIADRGVTWASLGQVTAIDATTPAGLLLDVTLQPSGREVQARFVQAFAGNAVGLLSPVAVDDEVLVIFPSGDANTAVALGGLFSSAATAPTSFANEGPHLVHPDGLELRTTQGATVQRVVLESLLPDLMAGLIEVQAALTGLGLPVTNLATLTTKLATLYRANALKSSGS